jgi:proteasome lid subunit RPN8/RPN11
LGGVVRITSSAIQQIIEHARQESPNECCGLLVGLGDHVHRARAAGNLERSPTRYTVDPRDHFAALREARAQGLQVIGAYHSHPASPAEPSASDRAEANDSTFLYLIVSLAQPEPELAAYRIEPAAVVRLALVATGGIGRE